MVARADGDGLGPDQQPRVRPLPDWLKYQALAERIWARRGFYQSSGAYGFRDQLQDSVNLIWMDPELARRQILLHASQQFLEGDVVHWFHRLQDGRTGFVGADARLGQPPLAGLGRGRVSRGHRRRLAPRGADAATWKPSSPSRPCPQGKHGMGFDPLRSSREDTVYRHCLKAIDLVLETRMGAHGLPLIGHRRLERRPRRDRQPGPGRERLARLLPRITSSSGWSGIVGAARTGRRPRQAVLPSERLRGSSKRPWNRPGAATATSAPSTTTAPRSASRGAASGRSTP